MILSVISPRFTLVTFLFICCLFGTFLSIAQSDTDSLDYYFDDSGISRGIKVKTDIISIVHGDFPLLIETKLRNSWVLETGPGLILPYYVHDFLPLLLNGEKGINNNTYGYSARIHLKWYGKRTDRDYWGMQYYYRAFHDIDVTEWTFTRGDQRIVGKRLVLDIAVGLGLRFQKAYGDKYMFDPDFNMMPIFPLMLKLGYVVSKKN